MYYVNMVIIINMMKNKLKKIGRISRRLSYGIVFVFMIVSSCTSNKEFRIQEMTSLYAKLHLNKNEKFIFGGIEEDKERSIDGLSYKYVETSYYIINQQSDTLCKELYLLMSLDYDTVYDVTEYKNSKCWNSDESDFVEKHGGLGELIIDMINELKKNYDR